MDPKSKRKFKLTVPRSQAGLKEEGKTATKKEFIIKEGQAPKESTKVEGKPKSVLKTSTTIGIKDSSAADQKRQETEAEKLQNLQESQ
jgi:hypothetical protein